MRVYCTVILSRFRAAECGARAVSQLHLFRMLQRQRPLKRAHQQRDDTSFADVRQNGG